MKYLLITLVLLLFLNFNKVYSDVLPNDMFSSTEVVELQMTSLQTNSKNNNSGIYQCWLFAHPENKKFTGPYERFEKMILSNQYKILLNHVSHKITLITNSEDNYIYNIELITKNKKIVFYEWHLEKSTTDKCDSCWFTTIVLPPVNIGNTI